MNSSPSSQQSASFLTLQPTEGAILQSASTIYAGYLAAGRVEAGDETTWIRRSVMEAIQIARAIEKAIVTAGELT